MIEIPATDLILNKDGSVYHLCLRPENLADIVIIVKDPQQLKELTRHFTKVDYTVGNREFISNTGFFHGKRLTGISTGIGTSNGDIVMNELDALVNIDLSKREQLHVIKPLKIIRIASTSTIQSSFPLNSFCLSTHSIGFDNVMHFYKDCDRIVDASLTNAFINFTQWPGYLSSPYFYRGSEYLISKFKSIAIQGITATFPGFYGPQGKILRLGIPNPNMLMKLESFRFDEHRIINIDMESSVYYGLGGLMGHDMLTISSIDLNNKNDYHSFNNLIEMVLNTLVNL